MSTGAVRASAAIPGLPGAHTSSATSRSRGEPGDKRVLARAAAEDENSHVMNEFMGDARCCTVREDGGDYFVDLDGGLRLESALTCDSLAHLVI